MSTMYLLLNIGYVSNETNTDVSMYACWIYSGRDLDTLLHKVEVIYIGNYTGIYTIETMDEECENCIQEVIDTWGFK